VVSQNALLDILEGAEIVEDIPSGIIEIDVAVFIAGNSHQPIQLITIFQYIVDGLVCPLAGNDGYLGFWSFAIDWYLSEEALR